MSERVTDLSPVVVICTLDRPNELRRCLASLAGQAPRLPVVVVDASRSPATRDVCAEAHADLEVTRVATEPGLSRQRNLGVDEALRRGADIVLFVDDDIVCEPGYVDAVLATFAADPTIGGVGGVVVNEPEVSAVGVKTLFRLWSRRPGVVLPSGRNVLGHQPSGTFPREVQWLSTCTASIRLSTLGPLRFDERLAGYSYGEDLDLTYRLGRASRLVVIGSARARHELSPVHRPSPAALARRRTVLLHAWVKEQRGNGLRLRWFWWSVVGELLLSAVGAVVGRQDDRQRLRGVVTACSDIARGRSRRDFPDLR